MAFRWQPRGFALRPLVGSAVALLLVLTVTGVAANWSRAIGAECADPGIGDAAAMLTALDVSAAPLDANGNGNDNGDNGNGNKNKNDNGDNGNGNKNKNNNDNGDNGNNNDNSTPAVSCDAGEAAVGAQPRATDTQRVRLDADHTSHTSFNGVVSVDWVGGGAIELLDDPVDPNVTPGPGAPAGQRQIRGANLQMLPDGTPNNVTVVLHYTDSDVQGPKEVTLHAMVWNAPNNTWVQVGGALDPGANSVTVTNVDVSLFAPRITRIGLFVQS